jgi:hypothetical protein
MNRSLRSAQHTLLFELSSASGGYGSTRTWASDGFNLAIDEHPVLIAKMQASS